MTYPSGGLYCTARKAFSRFPSRVCYFAIPFADQSLYLERPPSPSPLARARDLYIHLHFTIAK